MQDRISANSMKVLLQRTADQADVVRGPNLTRCRRTSSFGGGGPYSGDAYVANASSDADRGKYVPCGSPSRRSNSRLLMA
jgi:hypothetical protein